MLAAAVALLATLLLAGVAAAATPEPWQAAADVRAGLRSAGIELLTDDTRAATADVREATAAYRSGLAEPIERADASADRDARDALRRAERAAGTGDVPALADALPLASRSTAAVASAPGRVKRVAVRKSRSSSQLRVASASPRPALASVAA